MFVYVYAIIFSRLFTVPLFGKDLLLLPNEVKRKVGFPLVFFHINMSSIIGILLAQYADDTVLGVLVQTQTLRVCTRETLKTGYPGRLVFNQQGKEQRVDDLEEIRESIRYYDARQ